MGSVVFMGGIWGVPEGSGGLWWVNWSLGGFIVAAAAFYGPSRQPVSTH